MNNTYSDAGRENMFLPGFLLLSVISGITIGVAKVVTQLFALDLGATPAQIGVINAMESAGMMLLSIPAGIIVARHGARMVYGIASLGPLFLNLLMPFLPSWWLVAAARLLIGLCIPFRTVSMNTAFLDRLPQIGRHRAGWYRASLMLGMIVLGPMAATFAATRLDYRYCFALIAGLFAVMALFGRGFFPGRRLETADMPAAPDGGMRVLLRHPAIRESCLIECLGGATSSLFAGFILLVALQLPGLGAMDGARALSANGLALVLLLSLAAKPLTRLPRPVALLSGFAFKASALAIIGISTSLMGLVIGGILLAAGAAQLHLLNMTALSALPYEKGRISACYQLSQMIGATVGALIAAWLARFVAVQNLFLLWLLPIIVAGIGLALLHVTQARTIRDSSPQ